MVPRYLQWLPQFLLEVLGYVPYERVVIGTIQSDPLASIIISEPIINEWLKGKRKNSIVGSTSAKSLKRIVEQEIEGSFWVVTDKSRSYLIILARLEEGVGIAQINDGKEVFVVMALESFNEAVSASQRANARYCARAILLSVLNTVSKKDAVA